MYYARCTARYYTQKIKSEMEVKTLKTMGKIPLKKMPWKVFISNYDFSSQNRRK